MNTEGGCLAEWRAQFLFGETLVVEAVPGLVEDAIKRDHEVGLVVAGGHPGVVGAEAGTEGVSAGVESPGGDIEADFWKQGLEKLFLIAAEVMAGEVFAGGVGGDGEGFFSDGDEARLELGEKGGDFRGFPAGFVAFEKGVIGLAGVTPEIGHAAGKGEEFFEMGGKGGEVGFPAGLDPDGAGEAAGALVFLDQIGGDLGGAVVVAPPAGKAGGLRAPRGRAGGLAGAEPLADFRSGGEAVGDAGDLGRLFRAEAVGFGREEGFLVPTEKAAGGAKEGQFPPPSAEFLVGHRQVGHSLMMRQENIPWNVGMSGTGLGPSPVSRQGVGG